MPISENPLSILYRKLKRLKQELKCFNQLHFGNLTSRIVEKRKELASKQIHVLNDPSNPRLVEEERSLFQELFDLLHAEEGYFNQKSKINWIREEIKTPNIFRKLFQPIKVNLLLDF